MGLLTADDPIDTLKAWGFVIVQFALLVAIIVTPGGDDWTVPAWMWTAATWLEYLGVAVLVLGIVNLGRSLTPLPSPVPHGVLQTWGLYRLVRHPIYTGIMALGVGAAVRSSNTVVAVLVVALILWFMWKARWEEAQLRRRYPDYEAYAAVTPRFVPFWPFGSDRHPRAEVDAGGGPVGTGAG